MLVNSYRFATTTPPPVGSGVLLHFDAPTIVDEFGHSLSGTPPTQDTSTAVFGPSSGLFSSGKRLLVAPATAGEFDFTASGTIQCWLLFGAFAGAQVVFDSRGPIGSGYSGVIYVAGGILTAFGFPVPVSSTNVITAGVWTHFALTRDAVSGHAYVGLGGVITDLGACPALSVSPFGFYLGSDSSGNYMNGNMDEFYLQTNTCDYAGATGSTYTPPAAPFPPPP